MVRIGDRVRLLRVPPDVEAMPDESVEPDEMHTKDVFRRCVGRVFRIRGIGTNSPNEDSGHVELWVRDGDDCDDVVRADTIWVEPEHIEIVTDAEGRS